MSLPSGYRLVEYIESTGTQYIDTHYVPNANTRFVVDTQFRDVPSGGTMYMMGLASISSTSCRCAFGMGYINNKTEWYFGIGDVNNDTNITPDTDRHTFYVDVYEKKGMLDDVVYNTGTTFTSYNAPAYLFARNKNSIGEKCKCKLYGASFAEHDGDTVVAVHEYIPVVREQDEKPGLYDTVADAFLTNNGTGEFLWEEIPDNHDMYVGVNGIAQKAEKLYIGVNGVAREVSKAYIGVNGVAQLCHTILLVVPVEIPVLTDTPLPYRKTGPSHWSAPSGYYVETVIADLGDVYNISKILIYGLEHVYSDNYTYGWTQSGKIYTSVDGETWEELTPERTNPRQTLIIEPLNLRARYVKSPVAVYNGYISLTSTIYSGASTLNAITVYGN